MFRVRNIFVIISLFLFISSGVCFSSPAEIESTEASTSSDDLIWDGFESDISKNKEATQINLVKQFTLAIFVVALLGFGTFYFSKKIAPKLSVSKGKRILITESVSLGQNKTLHLVEIENKKLLIGSTPNSIVSLAELTGAFEEALQTCQDGAHEL